MSIPPLQRAISSRFTGLETLIWAPSRQILGQKDPRSGVPLTTEYIASTFFNCCHSLSYFVFLERSPTEHDEGEYTWFSRETDGQVYNEGAIGAAEVDDFWRMYITAFVNALEMDY